MPAARGAKTASAPNWRLFSALILAAILLLFAGLTANRNKKQLLVIGNQTFTYETAKTADAREKGLSGKPEMPQDHAMIFLFQQAGKYCFWMKDMNFPLDMIWLDASKQVVHMEQNLSPSTYPQQYCPDKPSLYVLEVNAGMTAKAGLRVGDSVSF